MKWAILGCIKRAASNRRMAVAGHGDEAESVDFSDDFNSPLNDPDGSGENDDTSSDDENDISAAREALDEAGDSIPYNIVRRKLGLE